LEVDIKALTVESPELIGQLGPAFEKYNEEQFATVKLPGGSQQVCFFRTVEGGDDWKGVNWWVVGYCELAQLAGRWTIL
jgi:hypothetical protein